MTQGYIETEHGEFNIIYVQSFKSLEELIKADILTGHSDRDIVLKKLWDKCKKPESVKVPASK